MTAATLAVEGLTVAYERRGEEPNVVVRDVSFELVAGSMLGLAGESGCGKSTAALAAIGFRGAGARRLAGTSVLRGDDLLQLSRDALRKVWGRRIAYVAQDAMGALNPLQRIETQVAEPLRLHLGIRGPAARERSLELLEQVGIPDPPAALRRYPHQFSGGQQQRLALAIAMSCEPEVLVLDEPTTGLDVTTQRQISALIARLVERTGAAALHISHDLSLLASTCADLAIMYAGEIVERGAAEHVYAAPAHPYSAALLEAVPEIDEDAPVHGIPGLPPPGVVDGQCSFAPRCRFAVEQCWAERPPLVQLESVGPGREVLCVRAGAPAAARERSAPVARAPVGTDHVLRVEELTCTYPGGRGPATTAVDGVTLELARGETLAIVGESGSGKSTLLRAIAGLHAPEGGTMEFDGAALADRAVKRSRELRRAIQIVFQNPHASLNPRQTVRALLERPVQMFRPDLDGRGRQERIDELLSDVLLDRDIAERFPHELSGGQKQRVALARAFAADPRLLLCDEVVSALDVSVQASILELLGRLTAGSGTSVLFVTHDLAVARQIADGVCVVRHGEVCETGDATTVLTQPSHPYTRELLEAVPRPRG
jgi:peptide/nickel transport system ATP-binding protein